MIHTLQLSSAKRITAVIPYYGYARQDRKTKPRTPISAAVVAHLIETMGPHRVVCLDLHCGQIQGFFRQIPVDHLNADNEFVALIRGRFGAEVEKVAIVSPDAGGVPRARHMADLLGASNVITILKRRTQANKVDSMQLVGDVSGQICFICDDMIDTGGTICKAAAMLMESGATKVFALSSHGIFSSPALERLNASCIEEVWVTDSINQVEHLKKCPKLKIVPIAPLMAECIKRLHNESSLSSIFQSNMSVVETRNSSTPLDSRKRKL